jgi:hypothetical protein
MKTHKTVIIAAGLAFLATNLGIILYLVGIPWLWYPAAFAFKHIFYAVDFSSSLLSDFVCYVSGFLLFFAVCWAGVGFARRSRAA